MRQLAWCLSAHAYMNELGKGPNYTMSKSHIPKLALVPTKFLVRICLLALVLLLHRGGCLA